ncbi:nucleotide exchange factor GrpE [Paenibacillus pinihumi]|uniref:nucleotide exchange factor GrpE n=1 Tax=Paenibacillus pinihumi TaxID=669462 RepID=UPI00041303D1|nr:nucleotide exchange factor GrpE [Paenibacillus pinihumi]
MSTNKETVNEQQEQVETSNEELNTTAAAADVIDEETVSEPSTEEAAADPRIAELQKQADDNQQRLLRVQADYDNFRRRTQKEKEELAQYASMKLVTELLPVIDNFERAISAAKDSEDKDSFIKGVDMIFRQFDQVLQQEGLKPMDTVGQPFNPDFHQAIMQVESEEYEEGIVVEEVQRGYILKEKVLRPAMVKVSG